MAIFNHFLNFNTSYLGANLFSAPQIFNSSFNPFMGFNMPMFSSFNFFNTPISPFNSSFQQNPYSFPQFNFNFNSIFPTDIWKQTNSSNSWNNFSSQQYSWNQNFQTPNVNWGDTFTKTASTSKVTTKPEKNTDIPGYSAKLGKKLADIALNNSKYIIDRNSKTVTSKTKEQNSFTGYCATYVKAAIRDAGLGEYESGHAYELAGILRKNKNFKEISPSEYNVDNLPAGCILVYGKGSQNYNKSYGHTEITTGDKRAVSDGITQNLYKKPDAIFVPVIA